MNLELRDIRMSYTNARNEVSDILKGVNLLIEEGKVTALAGGNGAGKTTLFNIICGFEKGFQGQVLLDGQDISRLSAHRIARMGVGRLFQGRQLMGNLTLLENMKIADADRTGEMPFDTFLQPRRVAAREKVREENAKEILIRLFGAGNKFMEMLNDKASDLSYGEQRLIALACLLMGRNKLLLLDEPTSGVHPDYIDRIGRIIRQMAKEEGMTVLLIEHNMDFVWDTADRTFSLEEGIIYQ